MASPDTAVQTWDQTLARQGVPGVLSAAVHTNTADLSETHHNFALQNYVDSHPSVKQMYQYDSLTDPPVPPRECNGYSVMCLDTSGRESVGAEAIDANASKLPALEARCDGALLCARRLGGGRGGLGGDCGDVVVNSSQVLHSHESEKLKRNT